MCFPLLPPTICGTSDTWLNLPKPQFFLLVEMGHYFFTVCFTAFYRRHFQGHSTGDTMVKWAPNAHHPPLIISNTWLIVFLICIPHLFFPHPALGIFWSKLRMFYHCTHKCFSACLWKIGTLFFLKHNHDAILIPKNINNVFSISITISEFKFPLLSPGLFFTLDFLPQDQSKVYTLHLTAMSVKSSVIARFQ